MKTRIAILILPIVILLTSCYKEPISCFSINSESITDGYSSKVLEQVEFENCTKDAATYLWDFGDGTTSSMMNPDHKYKKAGVYTVVLEAEGQGGTHRVSQDIQILSINGRWEGIFKIGTTAFLFNFDLEQDQNDLTGTFRLDDGSARVPLKSSEIDGQVLTLKFEIKSGQDTYSFIFNGDVNGDYTNMDGVFRINGKEYGNWFASKVSEKSASSNICPDSSVGEQLLFNLINARL